MRKPAPLDYSVLDVARAFSVAAHCAVDQKRKYTGEYYFHHPEDVLQIMLSYDDPTVAMQVAALLHDVVEDTAVPLVQVRRIFGVEVAALVDDLTDVSKPEDGNRAVRKQLDLEHIANGSIDAMRIKCADLISNSKSIVELDPKFAKQYLVEKLALLGAMKPRIGRYPIFEYALDVCGEGIVKIWPEPKDQYEIISGLGFFEGSLTDYLKSRGLTE